jgi:hypothetical protein
MKWNLLIASCLVAVLILLMAGAPIVPVALGVALASVWCWFRHNSSRKQSAGQAQ